MDLYSKALFLPDVEPEKAGYMNLMILFLKFTSNNTSITGRSLTHTTWKHLCAPA